MGNVIISFKKKDSYFINTIIKIVAKERKITPKQLKGKSHKCEIVQARQLAISFAKEYTTASIKTIGLEIGGKHHATVLYSCETVNNLKKTNQNYRGIYYMLKEKIENAAINSNNSDYDFICINCGGINIHTKAWIDPNNKKFIEFTDYFPYDNWCGDCQINVQLITRKEFNKSKQEEQP